MSIALVGALMASLAPLSPARATHEDGSTAKPSASNCEWYGSVQWESKQRVDRDSGSWQEDTNKAVGWSGPSEDGICRGSVHYVHRMDSQGWSDGACYFARMDGTVPAWYEAYWNSSDGFSAAFYGEDQVLYESGWGTCSEVNVTRMEAVGASASCAVPGADTPEARNALQAVVVTCSRSDSGGSGGETWSNSETWTIRMRRTDCDTSVDTDGDDLADCTEFSLQTDPSDPDTDDDGLSDGQEVLTYKTDPLKADTDDGGVGDGDEIAAATDPLDLADDFGQCKYVNSSFVAKWWDRPEELVSPNQVPNWLRYSWDDLRFCYGDAGVRIVSTGSQRGELEDVADVAAVLDVLGMKLKYAGSGQVAVERLNTTSLQAKVDGTFKVCSGIPLLGPVVGKGIRLVRGLVPDRILDRLLKWGPRRIMKSSLIPTWVKNEIIRRGVRGVLRSFDALSDADHKRVMGLFKFVADNVGGKLVALLTDGKCFRTWLPEIVTVVSADGTYDSFEDGNSGPWWVVKDY